MGNIIFRASDWTAALAKKPEHGSKQRRGIRRFGVICSPFELLYGRTVRGPLAVIKETWLEGQPSEENLITRVLEIRRRLATMQQVVQENLKQAQGKQKRWYDTRS